MLSSLCEEYDVRVAGAGDALDRPSGRPPDAVGCLTVKSQPGCKLPCAYSDAGRASARAAAKQGDDRFGDDSSDASSDGSGGAGDEERVRSAK